MRRDASHGPWSFGLLVLALAACSTHAKKLRPAHGAYEVAGMDWAAMAGENQIEVIVQTRDWPGDPRVLREVEPLHVRIGNYGFRPVHLRYHGFRLVSDRGQEYAALLPIVHERAADTSAQRIVTPRFSCSGFKIAHYDAHVYTGLFMEAAPAPQHAPRARRWNTETFSMVEALEWAIPEGIIDVGGFVDGYMFFEHVSTPDALRFEALLTATNMQLMERAEVAARAPATSSPDPTVEDRVAHVSIPLAAD